ncbi:MAG: ABC transporter ATP-binding protein [Firmicutes bacterium]|nr:ABC transporter ATP-binding protein [Bacillota bacterium]
MLRQFLWRKRLVYGVSILSIIASEIVAVQFPNILGEFTNKLQAGHLTRPLVWYYTWLLFVVGASSVGLFAIGQFRNGQMGRIFEYELRRKLFTHWETLSTGYFRQRSIGDLLNHAMNDVRAVREALSGGVNILTNAIFLLIATLWMTLRTISVDLTLVSMIPLVFVPLFVVKFGPGIRDASRRVQESLSDMADLTEESLSAIRLIKATANERVEAARFSSRVDEIVRRQMQMIGRTAVFQSFIPLMGSLSFAIALSYGGYLTLTHVIGLGSFVAFTLYLAMIITPLQQIGFVINNFQRASASLTRLTVLLCEEPDIRDEVGARPLTSPVRGELSVRLPAFRYPDGQHDALFDVQFDAPAGATIGIVGRTGSGKTTLVNLLPRLFDPPPGTIFIDGLDVRMATLNSLRDAIAYVPQDGFLFSATIADNIAFARTDVAREEVEQAARDACLYDDILRFSKGFDTQIGERGVTLSGGQKQRAAIARALVKHAPILILDDSLSAVDMGTEKYIIAKLRDLRAGKTTLIVAHRLSAVRHADLILVLDHGRLAERGTHDELLARGGLYATTYELQETQSQEVTA